MQIIMKKGKTLTVCKKCINHKGMDGSFVKCQHPNFVGMKPAMPRQDGILCVDCKR